MASIPRVLISVISCRARPIPRKLIRDTWVPRVPQGVDLRFFLGRREGIHDTSLRISETDEVNLDADDSYNGLPEKVQHVFKWALEQGYEYCLKIDEDCVLHPESWAEGFLRVDFSGPKNTAQPGFVCPWGFCYCLSRSSMEIVVKAALPRTNNDEAWVTSELAKFGVGLTHDPRYVLHKPVYEKKRALRAPPRLVEYVEPVPGAFAWCIFIPGDTPDKREEYMKVWGEKQ